MGALILVVTVVLMLAKPDWVALQQEMSRASWVGGWMEELAKVA